MISGTSMDGIDVAIVDIHGDRIDMVAHDTVPYAEDVRAAILAVSNAHTHTANIARLNFLLGELFAEALIATAEKARIPLDSVQLIGSHGQTIFHEGEPVEFCGRKIASTMQIGEASVITLRTNIATFSDFRVGDMAAGGKGAPLVPFLDYRLFRSDTAGRVALNIGGIANITVIPAGATPSDVIAFDTGPGNMVMDALAPPFDRMAKRRAPEPCKSGTARTVAARSILQRSASEDRGARAVRRSIPGERDRRHYGGRVDGAHASLWPFSNTMASGSDRIGRRRAQRLPHGALAAALPAHRIVKSEEYGVDIDAKEAVLLRSSPTRAITAVRATFRPRQAREVL
jgi:1,6-anhydro-N-acetylmuramate kinase